MAKGGSSRKRENKNPSRQRSNGNKHGAAATEDTFDDEIDAFHKQRDIVPLDVDADVEGSEEDDVHPVFDFKGASEDDEDEDEDDDTQLTGLAEKIARKSKDLWAKSGGVKDEMHEDTEDEEDKGAIWGKGKNIYHGAENVDNELRSSDEDAALEEADALRLQKEKAKFLSMADYGLDDTSEDESDGEPTLEEMRSKEKAAYRASLEVDVQNDGVAYEVVKKDLTSLTEEEKMDIVYNSAPELIGLLSELKEAVAELENKVNPLLSKVKDMGSIAKGGLHYMEVKQLLLLAYCQAITFYLLLKSEGQPVRDHPVISRLVEIKNLLDKMKQLDENLPSELEDILTKQQLIESVKKSSEDDLILNSVPSVNGNKVPNGTLEVSVMPHEAAQIVKVDSSLKNEKKQKKEKDVKEQVGVQSMEMLKVRAALEEKLRQKGLFSSITSKQDKSKKHQQLLNGQLVTLADYDDDITDKSKGKPASHRSGKISQLESPQMQKRKSITGDDDLPKQDDIGEKRRKHELRVLAGAGVKSTEDNGDGDEPESLKSDEDTDMAEGSEPESEDDFYKQVQQQRAAKLAAKAELYSRAPLTSSVPEETLADEKRHISSQMEKNRGLTRPRKKLIKNPRKKYKLKHQKAVVRRKGQVRDIKKPTGPYGGETSGINAGISRSIRF